MRAAAVIPIERAEMAKRNSLGNVMEDERSPWEKTFYHRAIQTRIGEVLRAQYDQKHKPLPHRFLTLVMQLDEQQNADAAKDSSIRQLDREEVNMFVKRGEEFLMTGDFADARLMLQRAAEAGDPHASLVLGATYDPIELEHLGVCGRRIFASVAIARTWYEKAEQFGSAEARRRLELLAKRDP